MKYLDEIMPTGEEVLKQIADLHKPVTGPHVHPVPRYAPNPRRVCKTTPVWREKLPVRGKIMKRAGNQ